MFLWNRNRQENTRGSLTVETLLFLVLYIVFFMALLDLVQLTRAQVVLQYAADETAKEISNDSYVLTKMGVTQAMHKTAKTSKKFEGDTTDMLNNVSDIMNQIGGIAGGNIPDADAISTDVSAIEGYFSDTDSIINGLIAVIKSASTGIISDVVTQAVCKGTLRREIKGMANGRDPDEYLRSLGVMNGMSGLDFSDSSYIALRDGDLPEIRVVITYRVEYDLLFFKVGPRQYRVCAETAIW